MKRPLICKWAAALTDDATPTAAAFHHIQVKFKSNRMNYQFINRLIDWVHLSEAVTNSSSIHLIYWTITLRCCCGLIRVTSADCTLPWQPLTIHWLGCPAVFCPFTAPSLDIFKYFQKELCWENRQLHWRINLKPIPIVPRANCGTFPIKTIGPLCKWDKSRPAADQIWTHNPVGNCVILLISTAIGITNQRD